MYVCSVLLEAKGKRLYRSVLHTLEAPLSLHTCITNLPVLGMLHVHVVHVRVEKVHVIHNVYRYRYRISILPLFNLGIPPRLPYYTLHMCQYHCAALLLFSLNQSSSFLLPV